MTAQTPERILIDGKPHWLLSDPLYRLLATRRTEIEAPDGGTTACHRNYIGTWDIVDGKLWLVALSTCGVQELALSDAMRAWFLRLVPASGFPVWAEWFSGRLRIPTGPTLVTTHHGWLSWHTRERVITCRQGRVVRDREVDTLAMLRRALRRGSLPPDLADASEDPLSWITDDDYEPLRGDWWPPGWAGAGHANPADRASRGRTPGSDPARE